MQPRRVLSIENEISRLLSVKCQTDVRLFFWQVKCFFITFAVDFKSSFE